MPYKFETDKVRLRPSEDRRIKLTKKQKSDIYYLHHTMGGFLRAIARSYNVNRTTITYICYPERLEHNKKLRELRGGWRRYYNKDYQTLKTKEHRKYKKKVLKERCKTE